MNYQQEYYNFISKFPEYKKTQHIDYIRQFEYSRLDKFNHVYLDYTGGSLYSSWQLRRYIQFLQNHIFGNPHSDNPTSYLSTQYIEETKDKILQYFNTDKNNYYVIFTQNATGGLKLLGESYPFSKNSIYLLSADNHNSVNGIREFVKQRDGKVQYIPLIPISMRMNDDILYTYLDTSSLYEKKLFAYPAQSNFTGIQYSLEYINIAQEKGWDVLCDVAAFVSTNKLDLNRYKPNYCCVSFYKMFGFPTGIGCLLVRKDSLQQLERPWFSGGTIEVVSVQCDRYYLKQNEEAFEDGTVNYLLIPAIQYGLDWLQKIDIQVIHIRVRCLMKWLINILSKLKYLNGRDVIRLYGINNNEYSNTLSMNFYNSDGKAIDHHIIEQLASDSNISLRTGCFCNPGCGEVALNIVKEDLDRCLDQKDLKLEEYQACVGSEHSGAVRISLGIVSDFKDLYRFVNFIKQKIMK